MFGKGLQKRRRESDNTSRFIAEQVAITHAQENFKETFEQLKSTITIDVRNELAYIEQMFFRWVLLGKQTTSQRGPRGTLKARAQGADGAPSTSLGSLGIRWKPLGARYNRKKPRPTRNRFFINTGELAKDFIELDQGGNGQRLFERIFGPISVTIRRNLKEWGSGRAGYTSGVFSKSGPYLSGPRGVPAATERGVRSNANTNPKDIRLNLATITVSALGELNPGAITRAALYGSSGAVSDWNLDAASKLGGRSSTYRPSLEPFLNFFLEKSLAHAASERIRRGTAASSLRRRPR